MPRSSRSHGLHKPRTSVSFRILVLGVVVVLVSVFADSLGLGDSPGLGKGQVIGLGAGLALAFLGLMAATSR